MFTGRARAASLHGWLRPEDRLGRPVHCEPQRVAGRLGGNVLRTDQKAYESALATMARKSQNGEGLNRPTVLAIGDSDATVCSGVYPFWRR